MDALHKAIDAIQEAPEGESARVLRALIESLDGGRTFDIGQLYALAYRDFGLAIEVMRAWRLDSFRYERGWATRAAARAADAGDSGQRRRVTPGLTVPH